ncbi:hypothetical protein AB1Y20_020533 [Prymnesium parvum]|uniref:Uncharacterized protein n=1 Tax=Prymnesium parvum TaxID=97485 RepID=A0AB34JZL9_PRYPA
MAAPAASPQHNQDQSVTPPSTYASVRSSYTAALPRAVQLDLESKQQQIEVMSAMLKAADEELKAHAEQLDATTTMLRTTEAELARKDEQLQTLTNRLSQAEHEVQCMRDEAATLREELNGALHGASTPTTTGRSRAMIGTEGKYSRAPFPDWSRLLHGADLDFGDGEISENWNNASPQVLPVPAQLIENRQCSVKTAVARVAVTDFGADSAESMQAKVPIRDCRRSALEYMCIRGENGQLPLTRTPMMARSLRESDM